MSRDNPSGMPLHPMRVVVLRTGLTPDLLRVWEKRYGVVTPTRSAGGQRLYSDADVERLALLTRAVSGGRTISQVAKLSATELQAVVLADVGALPVTPAQAAAYSVESPGLVCAAALLAVERFDAVELESTLRGAVLRFGVDELLDEVIGPLLVTIGSRWREGHMRPAHEHLASAVIRRTLSWWIAYAAPPASAPAVVVATLAGQTHEFGALLAAATAVSQGWRVVYLGTSLPAGEIAAAAIETGASAVALSLVYPADDPAIPNELRNLRAALPPGTAIVAGGGATPDYMAALATVGASRLATTGEFRAWLRQATSTR